MTPFSIAHRALVPRLALLGAALLVLGAGACDRDPQDPEPGGAKPPWLWTTVGHFEETVIDLAFLPGAGSGVELWASAGVAGVFRQAPSPLGEWEHLGLEFPELAGGHILRGVNEVVSVGGTVLARVRAPSDDIAPVYRLEDGDWVPSDEGIDAPLRALGSARPGRAFAITDDGGVLLSEDGGRAWERVWDQGPLSFLVYSRGAGRLLVGGATDIYFPFLMSSADEGRTWTEISFRDEFSLGDPQRLSGVAVAEFPAPMLYLLIGNTLFRSPDWGETLEPILEIGLEAGTLLVNPEWTGEMVVVADRLYYSRDAGESWRAFRPPRGGGLGPAAADWDQRVVAVVERQPAPGRDRLQVFNPDAITAEDGAPVH